RLALAEAAKIETALAIAQDNEQEIAAPPQAIAPALWNKAEQLLAPPLPEALRQGDQGVRRRLQTVVH
ncbi:hypothetical protein, partial [Pseudomonas sp.]|uniref:hypothetical protein n=1 Tax=Pseudomonas sp. TaxID=306 RepID=UPI002FC8059F